MSPAAEVLKLANPHVVAAIAKAGESCAIVASQDIVDERGVKLLARNQTVSTALQQRLLERKLQQPLEACLRAEDGVTTYQLFEALTAFIDSDDPWAPLARQSPDALRHEVQHLPLHSVAQLLLTTARATQPARFDHAIRAMAVAGAMFAGEIDERYGLRLALLGGLLHDIGEMYVPPQPLESGHALDLRDYRAMAVHPRVGEMVLGTLTDYPPALCRAIAEHHERLDGSGYPARRTREGLSVHGRLLAVVEAALGVMAAREAPSKRADMALRLVPGEFDPAWASRVGAAAAGTPDDTAAIVDAAAPGLLDRLGELDRCMLRGRSQAVSLVDGARSPRVNEIAARALHLLDRLRDGWNSVGLWSPPGADAAPAELAEAVVAEQELAYRLQRLSRDCLWAEDGLQAEEAASLAPLWACVLAEEAGDGAVEAVQAA